MKVIVAGSRSIVDYTLVKHIIEAVAKKNEVAISEIVSGMANGVDKMAARWARRNDIPLKKFPANWQDMSEPCHVKLNKYGHPYNALAGFNRNALMAEYSDVLIAIWDGVSKGTMDMVKRAREKGLLVFVLREGEI